MLLTLARWLQLNANNTELLWLVHCGILASGILSVGEPACLTCITDVFFHLRRLRSFRCQLGRDWSQLSRCHKFTTRLLQRCSRWFAGMSCTVLDIKPRHHCISSIVGVISAADHGEYTVLLAHKMVYRPRSAIRHKPAGIWRHFLVVPVIIIQLRLRRSKTKTKDRWKDVFLCCTLHRLC